MEKNRKQRKRSGVQRGEGRQKELDQVKGMNHKLIEIKCQYKSSGNSLAFPKLYSLVLGVLVKGNKSNSGQGLLHPISLENVTSPGNCLAH